MVNNKNLDSVKKYLSIYKNEIIDTYQAAGVGIGKENPNDDAYVIVVYLEEKKLLPEQPIIKDGLALKFHISGPFDLH